MKVNNMPASEFEKALVKNMNLDEFLASMSDREDIDKIVKYFRNSDDFAYRDYLTIEEFCNYFKCKRNYALNVANYGFRSKDYIAFKLGKNWLIDRISYEKWKFYKEVI